MIRKARKEDFEKLCTIYTSAQSYMEAHGNPQWPKGHPSPEEIGSLIERDVLYVVGDDPHAAFALVEGEDPTYGYIEGAWSKKDPYLTIHRMASDGKIRGIAREIFAFAREKHPYIRIDTHRKNKTMLHALEKFGFRACGVIYLANGDERLAFDYYEDPEKR